MSNYRLDNIKWFVSRGIVVAVVVAVIVALNWNPIKRWFTDIRSNATGLERVINVYTANGDLIATYEGRIDIDSSDGVVKFDYDGKRYIYYNCFVETIADLD